MTIEALVAAAIEFGPAYVGGLPNIDRNAAEAADRARNNVGTFLADMEEMFPVEMGVILSE